MACHTYGTVPSQFERKEAGSEAPDRHVRDRVPVALAPEPVVDFETRRPKADENGEPLYLVQLLVMGEDSADLIAVKVPGVPSAAIRQGAPVKVTGLVAQPWTMADRSGVSFRAARIEPAMATAKAS
jgi:hypothetical protein